MSGRACGYYGPSDADVGCGCFTLVFGVLGVLLVCALVVISFEGCSSGDEGADVAGDAAPSVVVSGQSDIAIDVTDSHEMHSAGLPTKADVIAWHMYGRWGYSSVEDGVHTEHIFGDLPGGALVWDALYGVDNANPAFKFR